MPLSARWALLALAVLLVIPFGCRDSSPVAPMPPPPPDGGCAGVRGPVLALVMGGGTVLLPPEPNPPLEQLTADLMSDYAGDWRVSFTTRAERDMETIFTVSEILLRDDPRAELLIVGHSAGGADGDELARRLSAYRERLWLITIDPVRDTPAVGEHERLDSPVGGGRHYHIYQPRPGPTIPGTDIQLGVKIDYNSATVRRLDLPQYGHFDIKEPALPFVYDEIEQRFGACPK